MFTDKETGLVIIDHIGLMREPVKHIGKEIKEYVSELIRKYNIKISLK